MRLLFLLVVLALVIGGVFILYINFDTGREIVDMTGQSEISIVLTPSGYEPREVTIDKGTKVTFSTTRNNKHWPASNLHPTHEIYSELDPKIPLESNEQWSFVFDKTGTWGIHDHVRSYFTGIIYVNE
jgi:plastocyanin